MKWIKLTNMKFFESLKFFLFSYHLNLDLLVITNKTKVHNYQMINSKKNLKILKKSIDLNKIR